MIAVRIQPKLERVRTSFWYLGLAAILVARSFSISPSFCGERTGRLSGCTHLRRRDLHSAYACIKLFFNYRYLTQAECSLKTQTEQARRRRIQPHPPAAQDTAGACPDRDARERGPARPPGAGVPENAGNQGRKRSKAAGSGAFSRLRWVNRKRPSQTKARSAQSTALSASRKAAISTSARRGNTAITAPS